MSQTSSPSLRECLNLIESMLREANDTHGVHGLPDDVVFSDRNLKAMARRGGGKVFRAVAKAGDREGSHSVELHPANPGNALPYQQNQWRPKVAYYDPALADLETVDKDEPYIERTYARPKPHLSRDIEGLPDPNVMYRGMSAEEYYNFRESGEIKSRGDYNFDNQKGLTYWSTDVSAAISYANSFAPMQWKPTIGHPCFVVAAHLPPPDRIRRVPGTGEHEIGVVGATPAAEILAVWEGKVYDHVSRPFDLRQVNGYDYIDQAVKDGDTHRVRDGDYSAGVVWQRIK